MKDHIQYQGGILGISMIVSQEVPVVGIEMLFCHDMDKNDHI